MTIETIIHDVLVFTGGSVFGLVLALVVGYLLIKIVLSRLVGLLASVGLAALGWLLPKGATSFLKKVVEVSEKTRGPKILQFKPK